MPRAGAQLPNAALTKPVGQLSDTYCSLFMVRACPTWTNTGQLFPPPGVSRPLPISFLVNVHVRSIEALNLILGIPNIS